MGALSSFVLHSAIASHCANKMSVFNAPMSVVLLFEVFFSAAVDCKCVSAPIMELRRPLIDWRMSLCSREASLEKRSKGFYLF